MMPAMALTNWTIQFPHLATQGYRWTSPKTPVYNCIAWAADDNTRWWEPDPGLMFYWPPAVQRKYTVTAYVAAYRTLGYVKCLSSEAEAGYEKIAIYVKDKVPQHAAKLLKNGNWSSKLGEGDDIEHALDGLNGDMYGTHSIYMRRLLPKGP